MILSCFQVMLKLLVQYPKEHLHTIQHSSRHFCSQMAQHTEKAEILTRLVKQLPWCPQAMDSGGTPTEVQSLVLHPLALPSSTNHFISSSLSSLVFKVKIIKSTTQGVVRRLESVYVEQKSSVRSES